MNKLQRVNSLLQQFVICLLVFASSLQTASSVLSSSASPGEETSVSTQYLPLVTWRYCRPQRTPGVYLYLGEGDIQRARSTIAVDPGINAIWYAFRADADAFLAAFPTTYDPADGSGITWGGGGRYWPRDLALTYLLSGDIAYREGTRRILNLVASNTPPDTLAVSILHGAVPLQSLLFAYTVIRDTPVLTPAEQEWYDAFFVDQAELLEPWSAAPPATSPQDARNVPINADLAIATLTRWFPEDSRSEQLHQRAAVRLAERLRYWFDLDGGWGEYTENYAGPILEALIIYAETLRYQGCDLYQDTWNGKDLHQMCVWYGKLITPDGALPAMNDSVWVPLNLGFLEVCGLRAGDPDLAFASKRFLHGYQTAFNGGFSSAGYYSLFHTLAFTGLYPAIAPPAWKHATLAASGLVVLRSDWTDNAQYALLQFTDSQHHQHASFGNLVLYDGGPWLLDNGYQLGEDYAASLTTAHHSTLAVDSLDQVFTGGTLQVSEQLLNSGMLSVSSPSYPGVLHTRSLLWSQTLHHWLVVDEVEASGNHNLHIRWYVAAQPIGSPQALSAYTRGDDRFYIEFLPGMGASYSAISRSYAPFPFGNANGISLQASASTWPVRLVSLLTARPGTQSSPNVSRIDGNGGLSVVVLDGATQWEWLVKGRQVTEGQVQANTLTGQAGCLVSQSGILTGYCLYGGTGLQQGNTLIAQSAQTISLEAWFSQGKIVARSAQPVEVAIYWPVSPGQLADSQGQPIPFTYQDGLLTFTLPSGLSQISVH